jgi:hypothetical protein
MSKFFRKTTCFEEKNSQRSRIRKERKEKMNDKTFSTYSTLWLKFCVNFFNGFLDETNCYFDSNTDGRHPRGKRCRFSLALTSALKRAQTSPKTWGAATGRVNSDNTGTTVL